MELPIHKLRVNATTPTYGTKGAAGADLYACLTEPVTLVPGERKLIPLGLVFEIPEGFEVQIRPRSGLANKFGITVLNTPGTIDSDYRGEVMVMLFNAGGEDFSVYPGDRIAQMVMAPVTQAEFVHTGGVVSKTERGEGGFGSTGV